MQRIAIFSKVSYEQFLEAMKEIGYQGTENDVYEIYQRITLPRRATAGSAGYDFVLPFNVILNYGESIIIPTGIRCEMEQGWVLSIYPRSGQGFKYGTHLANTIGIIDQDYAYSKNEGHIKVKLVNDSCLSKNIAREFKENEPFCQGILTTYGITIDDNVKTVRDGGFGSTTEKQKKN